MEPDFNKLESKILKAAIKAEDDAIDVRGLDVDKSWQKISRRLNLQPKRESLFKRVSKFLMVDWGIGYGAQTSVLTFSFLVFGVLIGVGIDSYDVSRYTESSNLLVTRDAHNKLADTSYKVIKVRVDDPISFVKKTVEYAVSNNVDVEVNHEMGGRSMTLRNLKEMDANQAALKAFLEIPNSQSGTLKIYVQDK